MPSLGDAQYRLGSVICLLPEKYAIGDRGLGWKSNVRRPRPELDERMRENVAASVESNKLLPGVSTSRFTPSAGHNYATSSNTSLLLGLNRLYARSDRPSI